MSSNQLNQLLNALIDKWDTEKQNEVEFIDAIVSVLSSDTIDLILGSEIQALLNQLHSRYFLPTSSSIAIRGF